jgi:hypothetical protein
MKTALFATASLVAAGLLAAAAFATSTHADEGMGSLDKLRSAAVQTR